MNWFIYFVIITILINSLIGVPIDGTINNDDVFDTNLQTIVPKSSFEIDTGFNDGEKGKNQNNFKKHLFQNVNIKKRNYKNSKISQQRLHFYQSLLCPSDEIICGMDSFG